AVQMYTRLAEAASMYQVGKAGLWRPPDLQLALNWQAKHKPTLVWGQRYNPAFERTLIFLEYSKKEWETEQRIKEIEQKRKLQRARAFALVLGTFTIIAIVFLVFALYQKSEAEKQRLLASKNEQDAIVAKEAADDAKEAAIEAKEIAESAKEAALAAKELEAVAKQEAIKNLALAVENEKRAKENFEIANLERIRAEQNEAIANSEKDRANTNAAEALRRRYIAIAKAMAIKSRALNHDPEQQSLIAQQAYNFNAQHDGYVYDDDIYNGLYFALKSQNH